MFAVIKSGGKQYKVALGSILKLEKIDAEKNSNVIFKEVLMLKMILLLKWVLLF